MSFIKKYKEALVLTIFIILMAIFSIYDLQISNELINKESVWANILEVIGEQPTMIIGFIGSSILMKLYKPKKLIDKYSFIYILMMLLACLSVMGVWVMTMERAFGLMNKTIIIYGLVLAIGTIIIVQLLLGKVEKEKLEEYKKAAIITLICAFLMQIIVQGPWKMIWGRVRPRDLLADFSNFTNWYLPQGFTGNTSFPSGHSFNGWGLILLTLYVNKDNVKLYNFTWIFAIIFGILVCISRVVVAAHFPSDVLAGAMIMISTFYVSKKIFLKKQKVS